MGSTNVCANVNLEESSGATTKHIHAVSMSLVA